MNSRAPLGPRGPAAHSPALGSRPGTSISSNSSIIGAHRGSGPIGWWQVPGGLPAGLRPPSPGRAPPPASPCAGPGGADAGRAARGAESRPALGIPASPRHPGRRMGARGWDGERESARDATDGGWADTEERRLAQVGSQRKYATRVFC